MKNWKTNLGGAVSVTGTTLIGVGLLSQLTQLSPESSVLSPNQLAAMWYVALVGFVFSAFGKGLTALFAADADTVKKLSDQVNTNTVAINSTVKDP